MKGEGIIFKEEKARTLSHNKLVGWDVENPSLQKPKMQYNIPRIAPNVRNLDYKSNGCACKLSK